MRRLKIVGMAAVVFTLPWAVGGHPSTESVAAADTQPVVSLVTTTTTAAPVEPIAARETDSLVEEPPPVDLPAGDDYWTFISAGLPDDFVERVKEIAGVSAAYFYAAGTAHLTGSVRADGTVVDDVTPGWFIPLDAAIVAPENLDLYTGSHLGLGPDQVLLGESAAAFRGLGVGDTMMFEGGRALTVGAVIDDATFGEPELIALSAEPLGAERFRARAAVIRYDGSQSDLRDALEGVLGTDTFGLLPRHEHPDHGPRVVRSWVFMKQAFGEFEYRPAEGGAVEIDPAWLEENIVEVEIPLLGTTKCHRRFAATLTDVMNRLIAEDHADIITSRTFYGCWNPRYIRGTTRLSRHAFGIAADINFSSRSGDVAGSPVHSALLAAMAEFGVHSGHVWVTPDPGHFEFYGFPSPPVSAEELR